MRRSIWIGLTGALGMALLLAPMNADAQSARRRGAEEATQVQDLSEEEWEEGKGTALEGFQGKIASGDVSGAMDELVVLINDPEQAPWHGIAWANLGRMLDSQGYPYAATLSLQQAILLDPAHTTDVVPLLMEKAKAVGDVSLLEQTFMANVGLDVDPKMRSEISYLAARGNYVEGNYAVALGILALVGKDDPNYAKSQALKGVVLSQQGRYTDAMAALLIAQALVKDDAELLDTVNLNLGRVYYAAGNYPKAIEFYAQVRRESHWWPEAQFERAWAHFRLEDMNGTLSILHTHQSPFYAEGWYFPEAHLLRTYALFLICKFPEASKEIDNFQATWTPVRDELQSSLATMDAAAVFADGKTYVEGGDARLPELVLRDLPFDKGFLESFTSVANAEAELSKLDSQGGEWSSKAYQLVEGRRDGLIEDQGERLKGRMDRQVQELTVMLNDTEIAKLDMLRLETKLYEQASQTGVMPDAERKAERRERVKRGYVRWDFEGEYWADEVGYYRVEALPECPAGLMQGG